MSAEMILKLVQAGQRLERERIMEILDNHASGYRNDISAAEFKLPDGNDVLEVNEALIAFNSFLHASLERINGEQL